MAIDISLIEETRIIDGSENETALELEKQFLRIARKLYPEVDWNNNPLAQFKLTDRDVVNAGIYLGVQPPVVLIEKGLLDFVKNEDELAYVIGHELAHKDFRNKYDYASTDKVTKIEEATVDINSVLRCVKAGYNYHGSLEYLARAEQLHKTSGPQKPFSRYVRIIDPHPENGNRITAIELALANENLFHSGTIRENAFTPLVGILGDVEKRKEIRHFSFMDRFLPADYTELSAADKLSWQHKALQAVIKDNMFINDKMPTPRVDQILDEIGKIKAAPDDALAAAEAEKIIGLVQSHDPYNAQYRFDSFYIAAAGAVATTKEFLPTLAPFKSFGYAVDAFHAASPEYRETASSELGLQIYQMNNYLVPEEREEHNSMSSYNYHAQKPRNSRVIHSTEAGFKLRSITSPEHYPEAAKAPKHARLVWSLGGAYSERFQNELSDAQLKDLQYEKPIMGHPTGNSNKDFARLRQQITDRLESAQRLAAQKTAISFIDDPQGFIFAHGKTLFPSGNPNHGLSPTYKKPTISEHDLLNSPKSSYNFSVVIDPLRFPLNEDFGIGDHQSKTVPPDFFPQFPDRFDSKIPWPDMDKFRPDRTDPGLDLVLSNTLSVKHSLPEDFPFSFDDEFINKINFTKRSMSVSDPRTLRVPSHLVIAEQVRQEINAAFASGDKQQEAKAQAALTLLFSKEIPAWLKKSGNEDRYKHERTGEKPSKKATEDRFSQLMLKNSMSMSSNFYDAYRLDPGHPFAKLMLDNAQRFDESFPNMVEHHLNYEKMGEEDLRRVLGSEMPATIGEIWYQEDEIRKKGNGHLTAVSKYLGEEALERVVDADRMISLETENLLALSRLNGRTTESRNVNRLSRDTVETLHERLAESFSSENFTNYAKTLQPKQVIDIYQFMERYNLFSNRDTQDVLVGAVQEGINRVNVKERGPLCEHLLIDTTLDAERYGANGGSYTVKDLGLRDFAIQGYASHLENKLGHDDGSNMMAERLKPVFNRVINNAQPRDKLPILQSLSDAINIQGPISQHIQTGLKTMKTDILRSELRVTGVELLMARVGTNEELRKSLISYLSEPVSKDSIAGMSEVVLKDAELIKRMTNRDFADQENGHVTLDRVGEDRLHMALTDLHENFGNLSMDKKSGLLSAILVPGEHRLDDKQKRATYDDAIQVVFKKVFKPETHGADLAQSFAQSYLETAQDFERPAILAALMAMSSDGGNQQTSIPKQAAQIMSLLGPAYVKLGQAINSSPTSPPEWKEATAGLKSNSGIEPRWETILRSQSALGVEQASKITHFGPVLGAASFNTAIEVTSDDASLVTLLERPHAWTRAETGFEHLSRTLQNWAHPDAASYKQSVGEMVDEAKVMARCETDAANNDKQYVRAAEIYTGTSVRFSRDASKISIVPVSSQFAAEHVRLITLAEGVHFSDLPEQTPADLAVKTKIAKAYMAVELANILSGKGFDCDRHGQQLKVDMTDPTDIKLNVYDFGGLNVNAPSTEARKALGTALNDVAIAAQKGDNPIDAFEENIRQSADSDARAHLMETRKAWLALQDFQKYLTPDDMVAALRAATGQQPDAMIMGGFTTGKMLKTFSFGKPEYKIEKINPGLQNNPTLQKRSVLGKFGL